MNKLKVGEYYLLEDGERWCRKFVRYADNGDDVVMADSNGTETIWDCACVIRDLNKAEVAGWPNAHKTNDATIAQHKQVIAELVEVTQNLVTHLNVNFHDRKSCWVESANVAITRAKALDIIPPHPIQAAGEGE